MDFYRLYDALEYGVDTVKAFWQVAVPGFGALRPWTLYLMLVLGDSAEHSGGLVRLDARRLSSAHDLPVASITHLHVQESVHIWRCS